MNDAIEAHAQVLEKQRKSIESDPQVQLQALATLNLARTVELLRETIVAPLSKAAIEQARAEEREACCAILASAEPNTRAEKAVVNIDRAMQRYGGQPAWLERLIHEWCNAAADERKDLQALIRARGAK